jgi:hypothetical protein
MNAQKLGRLALTTATAGFLVGLALLNGGSSNAIGGLCNGEPASHTWLDASGQYGPALLDGPDHDIIGSDGDDVIDAAGGGDWSAARPVTTPSPVATGTTPSGAIPVTTISTAAPVWTPRSVTAARTPWPAVSTTTSSTGIPAMTSSSPATTTPRTTSTPVTTSTSASSDPATTSVVSASTEPNHSTFR